MPTWNTILLPPPRDSSEFEDLCRDLWARIWKDPSTQRNGRRGQAQQGVDVFGRPNQEKGVAAIQCKVRSAWLGQFLTERDTDEAISDAEAFEPALSQLTIATTSPSDSRLQEKVRLLSD